LVFELLADVFGNLLSILSTFLLFDLTSVKNIHRICKHEDTDEEHDNERADFYDDLLQELDVMSELWREARPIVKHKPLNHNSDRCHLEQVIIAHTNKLQRVLKYHDDIQDD
jgi:hypothetical protein